MLTPPDVPTTNVFRPLPAGGTVWRRVASFTHQSDAAVLCLYILLTLALTYPAVFYLTDHVIGSYRGDNFHYLWQLWYPAHALFDLRTSPFTDPDVYAPFGFSLIRNQDLSPATVLLFAPVTRVLGEVVTYNLLVLVSFPLTAFGIFLLARELWGSRFGAVLAGVAVGFCSYRVAHAQGHLTIVSTQWIPFVFLYLERTLKRPSLKTGALVGLFYALGALVTWYYAIAIPIVAGLYLCGRSVARPRLNVPMLVKPMAAGAIVAIALVAPFALPYVLATRAGAMVERPITEQQAFAASAADFFIPNAAHPFWGGWVLEHFRNGSNGLWPSEWQVYLGVVVLTFGAVGGFVKRRDPAAFGWLVVACGTAILSLGPSAYWMHPDPVSGVTARAPLSSVLMPVRVLGSISPFNMLRAWARMAFFTEMGLALLAAAGLAHIIGLISSTGGLRHRVAARGVALAVIAAAVVDVLALPYGLSPVQPRPVDTWLVKQPGKFSVMEYPVIDNAWSGPAMYSRRLTGKSIVMGYASYPPNQDYWPVLSRFPSTETLDLLEKWNVRYVVVNEALYRRGDEFWGIRQTWQTLRPQLLETGRLREVVRLEDWHVYELLPEGPPRLRRQPGGKR